MKMNIFKRFTPRLPLPQCRLLPRQARLQGRVPCLGPPTHPPFPNSNTYQSISQHPHPGGSSAETRAEICILNWLTDHPRWLHPLHCGCFLIHPCPTPQRQSIRGRARLLPQNRGFVPWTECPGVCTVTQGSEWGGGISQAAAPREGNTWFLPPPPTWVGIRRGPVCREGLCGLCRGV